MFMSGTSDEQGTVADIWDLGSGGGVVGPRNLGARDVTLSGAGCDATMQIVSPLKLPIRAT